MVHVTFLEVLQLPWNLDQDGSKKGDMFKKVEKADWRHAGTVECDDCSLTLGLEWYDSVPLLDRVTYFFFHSLFRELPLLFHRMLCQRQPRSLAAKQAAEYSHTAENLQSIKSWKQKY